MDVVWDHAGILKQDICSVSSWNPPRRHSRPFPGFLAQADLSLLAFSIRCFARPLIEYEHGKDEDDGEGKAGRLTYADASTLSMQFTSTRLAPDGFDRKHPDALQVNGRPDQTASPVRFLRDTPSCKHPGAEVREQQDRRSRETIRG
jgi:hypothetical protein